MESVALLVSAWIEIDEWTTEDADVNVALLVSAWIEMLYQFEEL